MRNIVLKYLIIAFILFITNNSIFANTEDIVKKASDAYQNHDYKKAIALYEELLNDNYSSEELYYNLGCAYFQNNDIASAALYFEKAYALNPTDEDITHNINIVHSRLQDKIESIPPIFYKRWYQHFTKMFTLQSWTIISLLSFTISLFLVLVYLLSGVMKWKKIGFYAAVFVGIIFILSIISCQEHYKMRNNENYAIIFTPTVTTKSSPDENSKNLFVIHQGTKVELTDNVGDWYEIKLANGSVGWLLVSDVRTI